MAQPKTMVTDASVTSFLAGIADPQIKKDSQAIARMMQKATKARPKMWGSGIVGFGTRMVAYADGSEREWMQIAFAPRTKRITLYVRLIGQEALVKKLGPHACGKGCLHIRSLAAVDVPVLEKIVAGSVKARSARRPPAGAR